MLQVGLGVRYYSELYSLQFTVQQKWLDSKLFASKTRFVYRVLGQNIYASGEVAPRPLYRNH